MIQERLPEHAFPLQDWELERSERILKITFDLASGRDPKRRLKSDSG